MEIKTTSPGKPETQISRYIHGNMEWLRMIPFSVLHVPTMQYHRSHGGAITRGTRDQFPPKIQAPIKTKYKDNK